MPLFPELELLFVHIPKNAGRSIEQALLRNDGNPDGGRRSILNRAAHVLTEMTSSRFSRKYLIGTLDVVTVAQHLTYTEMDLLGLLNDQQKSEFTSFTVCRNPYDRAVSSLNHFLSGKGSPHIENTSSFERQLHEWIERDVTDHNERAHRRQQIDYILDTRGHSAVQHTLRYENVSSDFSSLMSLIKAPEIELPWRGKSVRERGYKDYINDVSRKLIEREFGEDLEYFKYRF